MYQPPYQITSSIVKQIASISEHLGRLSIAENAHSASVQLRKINHIRTIVGTLQIEGNSLDEKQVTALLDGKPVLGSVREITEAKGAIRLYDEIHRLNFRKIEDLLEAHSLLMSNLLNDSGQFRKTNVGVHGKDGVSHIAPPSDRVHHLMSALFDWLGNSDEHPLLMSCVFHFEFEFIHPFVDGNGRLGRFWQSLILNNWNPLFSLIPVENMVRSRQNEYYDALALSGQAGESSPFIAFMLDVILKSLERFERQSDQASDQASDQVKRLLSVLSDKWLSRSELMKELSLSHNPTFRKNYLNPALDADLIEMRFPNSPRSPQQKYRRQRD